eukprot:CAMPEP_0178373156 /NCGR_PEP_ID=MMETSP0689_2-20121128/1720_1 /TAXON_ID=160604 /ORGANISM="Amphidinium massartii, Strain CS-259" /LENGTH=407 /DNA_ID=CAMNT_0019993095 /DNA_START=101 /DNA_END=1321 /DNA_ORIENTATION=+
MSTVLLLRWAGLWLSLLARVVLSQQALPWTAVHQWSTLASNITLLRQFNDDAGNISSKWRILHITDVHISLGEASDLHADGTRRMHNAFRSELDKHLEPGVRRAPAETFRKLIAYASRVGVDAIVLGGDIVNFPHNGSVQYAVQALQSAVDSDGTPLPVIYTAGNHDWLVEGSDLSLQDQRERFRQQVLRPLYHQQRHARSRHLHSTQDVGLLELTRHASTADADIGDFAERLLVLTIDNSMHEVSPAQAEFFRRELSRGFPAILVVHVPFMLPGVTPSNTMQILCGDPRYGWDNDRTWNVERRQRWPRSGTSASTKRFIDDLVHRFGVPQGPLLAVLGGHEHDHRADALGASRTLTLSCKLGEPLQCESATGFEADVPLHEGLVQYVTEAGFRGGYRLIEVRDARG